MSSWLLGLGLVPVAAFVLARRLAPSRLWRIKGFAFGAVVSPASAGLYSLYSVGPLAALFGPVGLPLTLIHGGMGYDLAIRCGLLEPRTSVEGVQHVYIELLNGAVWSVSYGILGWLVDSWRGRTAKRIAVAGGA